MPCTYMKKLVILFIALTSILMNTKASNVIPVTLTSQVDSLPLSLLIYKPDSGVPLKAVVQLVHGMCEHKERYIPFMEYLTQNGYIAVIHDHRGHGQSLMNEEDLGHLGDSGYEAMVADAHQVTQYIRDCVNQDAPLYLFGHSMGSRVVRGYTKRFDSDTNG